MPFVNQTLIFIIIFYFRNASFWILNFPGFFSFSVFFKKKIKNDRDVVVFMNVEGLEEAVEEGKISGISVNISTFRYTRLHTIYCTPFWSLFFGNRTLN